MEITRTDPTIFGLETVRSLAAEGGDAEAVYWTLAGARYDLAEFLVALGAAVAYAEERRLLALKASGEYDERPAAERLRLARDAKRFDALARELGSLRARLRAEEA